MVEKIAGSDGWPMLIPVPRSKVHLAVREKLDSEIAPLCGSRLHDGERLTGVFCHITCQRCIDKAERMRGSGIIIEERA